MNGLTIGKVGEIHETGQLIRESKNLRIGRNSSHANFPARVFHLVAAENIPVLQSFQAELLKQPYRSL